MEMDMYYGPIDEQLEAHLPPQTDDDPDTPSPADMPPQLGDTDFDASPIMMRDCGDHWDVIMAHDHQLMILRKQVKALDAELVKWQIATAKQFAELEGWCETRKGSP